VVIVEDWARAEATKALMRAAILVMASMLIGEDEVLVAGVS